MAGFLLEDDAIAARQQEMDTWLDERKRQAEQAKQAAAAAVQPAVQAVQQVAQPVAQAVQSTATDYLGTLNAEQQKRQQEFDAWMQSRQATQPAPPSPSVAEQTTGNALPSLSHAEEPATSTDTIAAPDLGGRWKTNFDFGATYTGSYRTGTPHRGVDMVPVQGGIGTEVSAFHPGTVSLIQRDRGAGGLMVYVQDDQGLTHAYMHLANTQPGLKVGDRVNRGTPIAQMGESGTEGSPHLHYEVRKNAASGDPLNQLIDPRPYVAGQRQQAGAAATAAPAPATTSVSPPGEMPDVKLDTSSPEAFVRSIAPAAAWVAAKTGIPAAAMIGMAANETGYGKHAGGNNLFGIKGQGPAGSFNSQTWEDYGAGPVTIRDAFRAYNNVAESFQDFADLVMNAPRYAAAKGQETVEGFVSALKAGGYMTDPNYVGKITSIVNRFQDIIGQTAQPVQRAVETGVGTARAGAETALGGAVEQSGVLRRGAEDLVTSTQQTGERLRQEADAARARFDQWQAEHQRNAAAFTAGTQRMVEGARAGLESFDPNVGLRQAGQMAQDFAQTDIGRAATSASLPPLGGQSLGQMGRNLEQAPENLATVGRGIQAGSVEAERQMRDPLLLQAARGGVGLAGQTLSPEIEEGFRSASRATPLGGALLDPGGVVSAALKGGGMDQTISLPMLGDVPLADILGLASNLLIPTGAEGRFGSGALRTGLTETSRLNRPLQQWGPALAAEQALGAAGRGVMDQAKASSLAISAAGRWARSSVEDIANDLGRSPVGDFLRDESGELDLGKLMQVATKVKQEMVRVYQGTAGDFGRADLSRADPDALYGPGLYTTEDPRVVGGRVSEAQEGWAARFGSQDLGYDYGPIRPTQKAAQEWNTKANEDLLAQYSGLDKSMLPKSTIVPRSLPAKVEEEGYAQAAASRAGLPAESTFESWDRNIARLQAEIEPLEARLAKGESPDAPVEPGKIANPIGPWLEGRRQQLQRMVEDRERGLASTSGPNVRAIDVPKSLRLFDIDEGMSSKELYELADFAAERFGANSSTERVLIDKALTAMRNYPPSGQEVYDALLREAGLSKTQANNFLELAGFDGITHAGGGIRPMMDEAGQRIEHQVRVLFQRGLDKSRGAYSGNLAAAVPGGAAGAGSDEDLSPQERLYRGLGGAFVAGTLRGKNPAVAAFENQALRKGATAQQIAVAVQTARQEAGKAYKFAGPIADAANEAFNASPARDAVLAARQFIKDFGGNLKQAAPPNAQTDSGMARLHNHLLELARQGETQRFWYTNASEAINEAAQGDKVKAEKLAQLFAIYSPGATVSANTQMALAAWHQWLEGVPIAVGKTDLDKKASALLYDNKPWNGRKTNNFYRNLMKRIDEDVWLDMGRQDGQTGTTVDIWMMRALKYLQDAPSMGAKGQYEFSQRAIERVAKELGWQPDEAQAAIWSSVKAASEGTGLTEAGYHYGTGLAERTAQVGGTRLPPIFQDDSGQDVLAKAAGLFGQEGQIPLPSEKASRTMYDAEGNPIYNPKKLAKGVKEAISETIPEAKGVISAAARQTIDAYAAARAWVEKLPEIRWSRVFVEAKPTLRDSNSLAVRLGREITPEEAQQVMAAMGGDVTVDATRDGAVIVNMAGKHERTAGDPLAGQWIGESNVDFHRRANMALSELESVEEAFTHPFRADTTTLMNDWSAQPNGEGFADVINRSKRAEALWDVARPLAARATEGIAATTAEPLAGAQRAATEPLAGIAGATERGLSGAADVAAELGRPRLADTGLAQGLRGALQPTDAEVLAAVTPQARANAERLVNLTTDNPTETDIANALRASEIGAGAAGPQKVVGSVVSRAVSGSAPARASAQFAANLGGGVSGVAASEATMSEEDRANPWVRITRDLAFGGAGLAAPGVARGVANQAMGRTPSLDDLAQIRRTLGAKQMPLGPLPSQTMTPAQVISAVGKQNLLTGIPTHLANIASQLVEMGLMPARAAVSGRGDEAYIGLRAAVGSVPEALSQFRKTFTSGISTTATPGQQTQKWLPIFRFIGATDDFFRVMGGHMGSAMEAQHLVNEAGASTAADVQRILKANEGQIFKAGEKSGAASVFQAMGASGAQDMQTPFGRWKESLLGALPAGPGAVEWGKAGVKQGLGLVVDALVPFSGMPARLFDIGIGRLPGIGETRYAINLGRALAKGDKRAAQEALGDLGVQSIVSGVIVSNTLAGNVTGPENKEHPNSVKINGTWVDYSRWGAFQLPLAIPASTIEAVKLTGNKPDAKELDYMSAVGNAWFKTARNAFFLDGAFDLIERIGGGSGVGAIAQTATSYTDRLTPSFLNQVEQAMDANIRQVSKEFPRSVVERVASRIPYLAEMLPAQVEMTTGGARIRERQGPLGVLLGAETGQQPKVERELYRLRDQKGYRDLSVPREAPTTVSVGGTTIRLTEAEQHKLAAERGKLIDQMAGEFVRSPGYEKLTDNEKALTLKALMSRAEGRNEALWLAMTPSAEVERRMAAGRDVAGRRELAGVGR